MSNQHASPAMHSRRHQRIAVSIDVIVAGVLESFDATIADLSEGGALITGGSLPARARCEIRYGNQTVYGLVMWSEIDRMGVRFPYELNDGPLHQLLVVTRSHLSPRSAGWAARPQIGFGKRGI